MPPFLFNSREIRHKYARKPQNIHAAADSMSTATKVHLIAIFLYGG
jgi:hypothetical protein